MKILFKFSVIIISINVIVIFYCFLFKKSQVLDSLEVGLPYIYYERFLVTGNPTYNYGWNLKNFIFDQIIYFIIAIGVFFLWSKKSQLKKTD